MEKISNIVRGSPRVSSVDLKSASAVRPGVPSFGRPIGESPANIDREGTTASRAAALHTQMSERRQAGPERIVEAMAEQFFVGRLAGPKSAPIEVAEPKVQARDVEELAAATDMDESVQVEAEQIAQPSGYVPRGSYVDVRA